MTGDVDRVREQLSEALRRQMERPVCKCGHPDNLHSALTNRDRCSAMGCECEWYAERVEA